jgi:hypothetical protein
MSLTLRTTLGCTEAVIDDDGGLKCFYHVADILSGDLRIKFTSKEDDFDSIDWEFSFHSHNLTLHYSIYTGVSIFPSRTRDAMKKDNRAVIELASVLEKKLLDSNLKRNIA